MRRSEINSIMNEADAFLRERRFHLPPFAYWTPEQWASKGTEVREILERGLGWDITDFGSGEFRKTGLFLFTLRNGTEDNLLKGRGKVYAEKVMIVGVDQVTPLHFHWVKTEDIINRGGGRLVIRLYNATAQEELAENEVVVTVDGIQRRALPGGTVTLEPGESITLLPYCYHEFWGADAPVLVGEVSVVNDDARDNRFHRPVGRFPSVEEDEAPVHLLVSDYSRYYRGGPRRQDNDP